MPLRNGFEALTAHPYNISLYAAHRPSLQLLLCTNHIISCMQHILHCRCSRSTLSNVACSPSCTAVGLDQPCQIMHAAHPALPLLWIIHVRSRMQPVCKRILHSRGSRSINIRSRMQPILHCRCSGSTMSDHACSPSANGFCIAIGLYQPYQIMHAAYPALPLLWINHVTSRMQPILRSCCCTSTISDHACSPSWIFIALYQPSDNASSSCC
jgi:hypothetical protein